MGSYDNLLEAVKRAGQRAWEIQGEVAREYKHDGSVLTRADIEINTALSEAILSSFPNANIIAEEQATPFSSEKPWTFTIDPIDGTDSYSQGMPGWCVAIGIHDHELTPVGGIVSAPRWGTDGTEGLFVYQLPIGEHGIVGADPGDEDSRAKATSLMIGSKIHRRFDFASYPGKIRGIGSSILHGLAPLIHPDVAASLLIPSFIWDISAAHGIVRNRGIEVVYPDGREVLYHTMVHRQRAAHCIIFAREGTRAHVLEHFTQRED